MLWCVMMAIVCQEKPAVERYTEAKRTLNDKKAAEFEAALKTASKDIRTAKTQSARQKAQRKLTLVKDNIAKAKANKFEPVVDLAKLTVGDVGQITDTTPVSPVSKTAGPAIRAGSAEDIRLRAQRQMEATKKQSVIVRQVLDDHSAICRYGQKDFVLVGRPTEGWTRGSDQLADGIFEVVGKRPIASQRTLFELRDVAVKRN